MPAKARRGYVRAWRREIGVELRDSVLIQRYLFHSPAMMDRVVRGANAYPEFAALLIGYATGRLTYRAARREFMRRFPSLALRFAWLALRAKGEGSRQGRYQPQR